MMLVYHCINKRKRKRTRLIQHVLEEQLVVEEGGEEYTSMWEDGGGEGEEE